MKGMTLGDLRRYAVARTLFAPTTLQRAIDTLGFVQADPIRAPARAQDLTLRHRVANYRVGDLERRYPRLALEEDFFVNYGFLPRRLQVLMHPRSAMRPWSPATKRRAQEILDFVRERGLGASATRRRALRARHGHQLLGRRVERDDAPARRRCTTADCCASTRRESGVRIYAAHEHPPGSADAAARRANLDLLADVIVRKYAPLPAATLSVLVRRPALRRAATQARDRRCARAREAATPAFASRRRRLVLARRRAAGSLARDDRRSGPAARAVRPHRLGSSPLRAAVGVAVSVRGVQPRIEATVRLLRAAAAVARARDRLGERFGEGWRAGERVRLCGGAGAPRDRVFRRELAAEMERMQAFLRI